ncbi:hypothetical protein NDU88_001028 [Pleurodeles waltl]|uniref:Uncharacterized protein n=1 Tax=Pleurodeles waltl TaxID=8319 RepID=A0AAV7P5G1_PLEWA|nr:hypothetical protein NDU88_001028 [Pleurodeles waltl]
MLEDRSCFFNTPAEAWMEGWRTTGRRASKGLQKSGWGAVKVIRPPEQELEAELAWGGGTSEPGDAHLGAA